MVVGDQYQWLADNPARGQCNVTALVVHDMFGGEILKAEAPDGWHFYNRIEGQRRDLTASQFEQPIFHADIRATVPRLWLAAGGGSMAPSSNRSPF